MEEIKVVVIPQDELNGDSRILAPSIGVGCIGRICGVFCIAIN